MQILLDQTRQDLRLKRLRNILPQLFGEMDDHTFDTILSYLRWKVLPGNQHLFQQGDEANSLFILISGRLQVVMDLKDGTQKMIGEITRGETVGEMAIFTGEKRSASILAVRDSVLVEISKEAFEEMITRYPTMVMNITRLIIERLKQRNTTERNSYKVVNVALVPICHQVDIADFASRLSDKMNRYGKARRLSATKVGRLLDEPEIAHASPEDMSNYHRLSSWLDEQEALNDYVIYQAEYTPTEWTKRCLRQADEILLIGHEDGSPSASPIEQALLDSFYKITTAAKTLILLHPNNGKDIYSGTSKWLEVRKVRTHHHMKEQSEKDMERLSRFLTGHAIGLVLSGGGAKGMAHIGIYKALMDYGFPIDMVGGTSIGSIIAGLIAMGWSVEKIEDKCRGYFMSNPTPLSDYNILPLISLLKGKKLDDMLLHAFEDHEIADLNLNFFCVSTNLTRTTSSTHFNGNLRRSIRSSISLPGIFPPVIHEGDLHIDGGIFNNLPIDIMGNLGVGRIIAVDFDLDQQAECNVAYMPSTWQIIKDKFTKKLKYNIPSLMSTIIQATTLNSDFRSRQMRLQADIFLNPDLSRFGLMEWKKYDEIVEMGYRHTIERLKDWEGF
ncbi:MAG: patatin-like phospholipase family protein [Saprospiraceae bacterium]